jgi:hypothetical protein
LQQYAATAALIKTGMSKNSKKLQPQESGPVATPGPEELPAGSSASVTFMTAPQQLEAWQQHMEQQQSIAREQLSFVAATLERLVLQQQGIAAQQQQHQQDQQQQQQQQPQQQQQQQERQQPQQQQPLQQFPRQQQSPPSVGVAASFSAAVREDAIRPEELTYSAAASRSGALENWLFKLEKRFEQIHLSEIEFQERIGIASRYWDLSLERWWGTYREQVHHQGQPVSSWRQFVAALRGTFAPVNDAQVAAAELLRLSMGRGESMDAYLQRADLLMARANGRLDDSAAALALLEGVEGVRFPFTVAAQRRRMRQDPKIPFAVMRGELALAALDEPKIGGNVQGHVSTPAGVGKGETRNGPPGGPRRMGGGGHAASLGGVPSSSSSSKLATMTRGQLIRHIGALQRGLSQGFAMAGEGEEDDGSIPPDRQVAPIGNGTGDNSIGSSSTCRKCGAEGHRVKECTSKVELRSCYSCQAPGHISSNCPRRQKGGVGKEGQPQQPPQGN